jgi:hypothetical protein
MKPIDPDIEEQRSETQCNQILGLLALGVFIAVTMSWFAIVWWFAIKWRFVS